MKRVKSTPSNGVKVTEGNDGSNSSARKKIKQTRKELQKRGTRSNHKKNSSKSKFNTRNTGATKRKKHQKVVSNKKKEHTNQQDYNSSDTSSEKNGNNNVRENQKNNWLHDNGCNLSNIVAPNKVLRSILHDTFPILYLPEYISRRCTEEVMNSSQRNEDEDASKTQANSERGKKTMYFELPSDIKYHYGKFLSSRRSSGRKRRSLMKNEKLQSDKDNEDGSVTTNNDDCVYNHTSTANTKHEDDDNDIHNFVRVIVIPLSSSLISKVARPSTSMELSSTTPISRKNDIDPTINKKKSDQSRANNSVAIPTKRKRQDNSKMDSNPNITPSMPSNVVINRYSKQQLQPKLFRINESLMTLVDGVISTLVHKRHNYKWKKQDIPQNGNKRSYYQMRMMKSSSPLPYNELCCGRNILSEGYNVASSDEVRTHFHDSTSRDNDDDDRSRSSKRRKVAHCMNMTPGIQCTQLNSCASYARCSPLIGKIHKILGDDLIREMLLHAILLIPTGIFDSNFDRDSEAGADCINKHGKDKNENTVSIDNGNYFQLCGPPLSQMTKMARPDQFKTILQKSYPSSSKKAKRTNIFSLSHNKNKQISDMDENAEGESEELSFNNQQKSATNPHWIVPRSSLFYSESYVKKVGFPPSHILNQGCKDDPNDDTARRLLNSIVQLHCEKNKNKRRKRWRRIRENGMNMCKTILRRHKKCDYARLLEKYCPLPKNLNSRNSNKVDDTGSSDYTVIELVRCWSSSENVISFLCAVMKHVFPLSFWGSEHNFHVIMGLMKVFVKLRRREQFPLKKMVHGVHVLDLKWLFHSKMGNSKVTSKFRKIKKSDHEAATILMHNQMKWFYCSFLIPLIRSTFYVTDTEFTGKQIHFYRKPVWSKFRSLAMDQLLEKQYKQITKKEATSRYAEQPMGFSRLRLLPKATGVRPITLSSRNETLHLCGTKDIGSGQIRGSTFVRSKGSTNSILRPVLDVLKYEYSLDTSRFGVGLKGLNHVYEKMREFVQDLRKLSSMLSVTSTDDIPLFFCSVDINKCYDNIDQNHLFKIMKEVVQEDNYLVQQNTILHYSESENVLRRKKVKTVCRPEMFSTLSTCVDKLSNKFSEAIILDDARHKNVSRDSFFDLIQKHLFGNVVISRQKFEPAYLTQASGIPQGSVLSTTLCNYYYGDNNIEQCVWKGLFHSKNHAHLLVRIVDDFLFITTSQGAIQQFMKNMLTGNPSLGVNINEAKSRVSHDTLIHTISLTKSSKDYRTLKSNLITKGNDKYFPWCGFLINTRNCAVHVDYGRFVGTSASDTLTVDRVGKEGIRLQYRMRSFIRPRCQPIFYDVNINKESGIKINFYQAIAFSAIKSVNYILEGMDGGIGQNYRYIFSAMINLIHYAFSLIHSRLRCNTEDISDHTIFRLDHTDALWLGTHSFQSVLSRKIEFRQLSISFQTFRVKLKTKSSRKSLTKVATLAMKYFDIESFEYKRKRARSCEL